MRAIRFLMALAVVLWTSILATAPAPAQVVYSGQSIPSRPTVPANSIGVENSYYLDLTTGQVFGPKTLGTWPTPAATTLITNVPPVSFIANPTIQSTMEADGALLTVQNSPLTAFGIYNNFIPGDQLYDLARIVDWMDVGSNLQSTAALSTYIYNTDPRITDPVSGKITWPNDGVAQIAYVYCAATNTWCWMWNYAITDQDLAHNNYPAKLLGETDINVFNAGTTVNPFSQIYNFHAQPTAGAGISLANLGTGPYGLITAISIGQATVAPGQDAFKFGSVYTPANAPYVPLTSATVNTGTGCTGGSGTGGPFPVIGGTTSYWSTGITTFNIAYDSLRGTYSATAAAATSYSTPPAAFGSPTSLTGTACTINITWYQGSDAQTTDLGFLTNNYAARAPITIINNGTSGCILGTYAITGGTLATNYPTGATVTITNLDANGGISTGTVYPFGLTVSASSGYAPGPASNLPFSGGTITIFGTGCSTNPQFTVTWGPASDTIQYWVTPQQSATANIYWRDLVSGATMDLAMAGANIQFFCGSTGLTSVNCNINAKGTGTVGISPIGRLLNSYTVLPAVASAGPVANGTGGTNGTAVYTVSGGTCATQPQLNVTWTSGALTVTSIAAAGSCSVLPTSPAALTYTSGTASGWTGATVYLNATASLPSCAGGNAGSFAYITDALSPSLGGALTGGGAVSVFALCAGSNNWRAI